MILRAAAIEPEIVDLSVIRQKLAYLIYEVIVISRRLVELHGSAPLRRGIIQTDLHVVLTARLHELRDDVALSVLPRGLRYRIVGILTRPVREAVVMLADENRVIRARLLYRPYPLLAVKPHRVERRRRHRLSVPVAVTREKRTDTEMEEHAELPVEELGLLL